MDSETIAILDRLKRLEKITHLVIECMKREDIIYHNLTTSENVLMSEFYDETRGLFK
jgi:hypothetical protein